MTGPFTPPEGDPYRLRSAAGRLGVLSASTADAKRSFDDGRAQVLVSVMGSNSAFRLTELEHGVRGVDAEFDHLRRAGEQVAGLAEEHARDLIALEDLLDDLRRQADRAEDDAHATGPDGSSPEAVDAHASARRTRNLAVEEAVTARARVLAREHQLAGEIDRVIAALNPGWKDLSPQAISSHAHESTSIGWARKRMQDGSFNANDAWLVVGGAYEEIAEADEAAEKATTSYQIANGIDGFFGALGGTVGEIGDAVLNPVETAGGVWDLANAMASDPDSTTKQLWEQFKEPFVEDWQNQEYGHAVGTGLEQALELLLGTKGATKATKAGSLEVKLRLRNRHFDWDGLPEWVDGGEIPSTGRAARLFGENYYPYGNLTREKFILKFWDQEKGRAGSWRYPPREGFRGRIRPNRLQVGNVIDRFGKPNGGFYASPDGEPFAKRALPPSSRGMPYHRYKLLKPLPPSVTEGRIAGWFGQRGGGTQYKFDQPMDWYIEHGYLERCREMKLPELQQQLRDVGRDSSSVGYAWDRNFVSDGGNSQLDHLTDGTWETCIVERGQFFDRRTWATEDDAVAYLAESEFRDYPQGPPQSDEEWLASVARMQAKSSRRWWKPWTWRIPR